MRPSLIDAAGRSPESEWFVPVEELMLSPKDAPLVAARAAQPAPKEPVVHVRELAPVEVEAEGEPEQELAPRETIDVEWQRLWLATQHRPWTTLALIPVGEGIATPRIAASLIAAGRQHLSGTIIACDETDVSLSTLQARLEAIAQRTRGAERVILALPELRQRPASLALAQAADAAILCIGLGTSDIDEAGAIVEQVGRGRVLGSVIFPERKEKR